MGRSFVEQLTEGQTTFGANISTLNNSNVLSGAINTGIGPRRFKGILHTGTLTGAASLNFRAQSSATEAGVYADIDLETTDPAINTITTDNGWFSIEIRSDQMPAGQKWLKFKVTETATADAVVDLIVIADCSDYDPGNQFDGITWTSQVVAMP